MSDALEDFDGSVKGGGREISNLRFADDIDIIAGSRDEFVNLTSRLDSAVRRFGMEISDEKSKILTTSRQQERDEVAEVEMLVDGHAIEEVQQFKYLGAVMNEDATSTTEIRTRLAIATAPMAKLNHIWKCREVREKMKIQLMKALVTAVALYGC